MMILVKREKTALLESKEIFEAGAKWSIEFFNLLRLPMPT